METGFNNLLQLCFEIYLYLVKTFFFSSSSIFQGFPPKSSALTQVGAASFRRKPFGRQDIPSTKLKYTCRPNDMIIDHSRVDQTVRQTTVFRSKCLSTKLSVGQIVFGQMTWYSNPQPSVYQRHKINRLHCSQTLWLFLRQALDTYLFYML